MGWVIRHTTVSKQLWTVNKIFKATSLTYFSFSEGIEKVAYSPLQLDTRGSAMNSLGCLSAYQKNHYLSILLETWKNSLTKALERSQVYQKIVQLRVLLPLTSQIFIFYKDLYQHLIRSLSTFDKSTINIW